MNERLVFGYGTRGEASGAPPRPEAQAAAERMPSAQAMAPVRRQPRDWAFTGLLAFTAVLYLRPQDQIPGLHLIPVAEVCAIAALSAMAVRRITRGLTLTRVTPELLGVGALGMVILLTAPFSIWPGGAVQTFTDMFAKVLLIFLLITNALTNAGQLQKFTSLLVLASGYIALRAVIDYARGVRLVEDNRAGSAVGGMFQNPNDLALNLVVILPLVLLLCMRAQTKMRRVVLAGAGLVMLAAIIVSHSRGGFLGLAAVVIVLGISFARRKPALVGGAAVVVLLAAPFAPSSYWQRMASITDDSIDPTGSRGARRQLLREAWDTFLAFPLYGVGAGVFQAYNPPGRLETWRETHNAILQVAAELGVLGLAPFLFLVARGFMSGRLTRRLLRRASGASPPPWQRGHARPLPPAVSSEEAVYLDAHAAAMTAALIGWFVCALFASVAYGWTFYYLLGLATAPHIILAERLAARRAAVRRTAAEPLPSLRLQEVRP